MIKQENRYLSGSRTFSGLVLALLVAFCLLAAWMFLGTLKKMHDETVKDFAQEHLNVLGAYTDSRLCQLVTALEDQARTPRIVNSVMGSSMKGRELESYLAGLRLLGRDFEYSLLDSEGELMASECNKQPSFSSTADWVKGVLGGKEPVWVYADRTGAGPGRLFWRLAVPVRYRGLAEGLLVAEFQAEKSEAIILPKALISKDQGLMLVRETSVLSVIGRQPNEPVAFRRPLPHSNMHLVLVWDHERFQSRITAIHVQGLFFFCGLTLLFVGIFYFLGRKKIVLPLAGLTETNTRLSTRNEALESRLKDLKAGEMVLREKSADLDQEKKKIEAIVNSVNDGIIVTDKRGLCRMANPAACRICNLPEARLVGRALAEHQRLSELIKAMDEMKTGSRNDEQLEFVLTVEEGPQRKIRASIALLRMDEAQAVGDFEGCAIVLVDITREREIDEMKSAFVNTAAHELRTPLTSLLGYSELLLMRKTPPPEKYRRYADIINSKTNALVAIVERLLDVSMIRAGRKLSLRLTANNLPALLEDVARNVREQYGMDMVVVDCEPCADFYFDRNRIWQVVADILSNALTYSSSADPVWVLGWVSDEEYVVVVKDDGLGMDLQLINNIFGDFVRGDDSTTAPGGLGLSLYLARHVIDAHDGRVSIESEEDRGTMVTMALPRMQEAGKPGRQKS